MNEFRNVLHPPCHYGHVAYLSLSHDASFQFIKPHGAIKCPSNGHFRISAEVVGYLGTFRLPFFLNTMYSDILLFRRTLIGKYSIPDSAIDKWIRWTNKQTLYINKYIWKTNKQMINRYNERTINRLTDISRHLYWEEWLLMTDWFLSGWRTFFVLQAWSQNHVICPFLWENIVCE